ncbi:MAG: beta-carotene ketolase (CrtW type) [Phormidesmis priestleyi Ana]|uniref:Beta-carotene ketolase (CrtW type) n=1 Tax=Phormidesmis priestleyi Ana TaxID=1666911 RepID=A0A0N8KNM3_9CYAN|nr:MAG: beta-carotene ketolase (CrtW type) [Phormidesmis priestleyi Ana]
MIRQPLSHLSVSNISSIFSKIVSLLTSHAGVAIALLIISVWAISLFAAFSAGASAIGWVGCICLILWFTFLYTGLFVTGHDAMHHSIAPKSRKLNRFLGELALFLYGFMPYDKMVKSHSDHHEFPASQQDPDFHNGRQTHPVLWYFRFMRSYWTLRQTLSIVVVYNGLYRVMGVPEANLLAFWAIPSLLSSVQLFYFGTYLVHRQHRDTYSTSLCANSYYWPHSLSIVSCYHFGYHREHHAFPHVPWWQLPQARFQTRDDGQPFFPSHVRVNQVCASSGSALAIIKSPFVQRDRTRLNT